MKDHLENRVKKIWKTFQKPIDKAGEKWYNRQAHAKRVSDWNLTIEQQKIEVQSKISKCEYKICQNQRETTLLKKDVFIGQ